MKIAWYCPECLWLSVSDSNVRHDMNFCTCGKTGVDLEKDYARWQGNPVKLARKKDGGTRWVSYRK